MKTYSLLIPKRNYRDNGQPEHYGWYKRASIMSMCAQDKKFGRIFTCLRQVKTALSALMKTQAFSYRFNRLCKLRKIKTAYAPDNIEL
jgi:hypothetical protein